FLDPVEKQRSLVDIPGTANELAAPAPHLALRPHAVVIGCVAVGDHHAEAQVSEDGCYGAPPIHQRNSAPSTTPAQAPSVGRRTLKPPIQHSATITRKAAPLGLMGLL